MHEYVQTSYLDVKVLKKTSNKKNSAWNFTIFACNLPDLLTKQLGWWNPQLQWFLVGGSMASSKLRGSQQLTMSSCCTAISNCDGFVTPPPGDVGWGEVGTSGTDSTGLILPISLRVGWLMINFFLPLFLGGCFSKICCVSLKKS